VIRQRHTVGLPAPLDHSGWRSTMRTLSGSWA
jgi:hypothetical protein